RTRSRTALGTRAGSARPSGRTGAPMKGDAAPSKIVAVYARYSSDRQSDCSIEDQARRCHERIARDALDPVQSFLFADRALSGSSMRRLEFERLMGLVAAGKVERIYVEDMSRLSRDAADSALIDKQLRYNDVRLVTIADGIDSALAGSKLSMGLRSLMAEAYLADWRDKTRRGLVGRALRGLATGAPPFGYRN